MTFGLGMQYFGCETYKSTYSIFKICVGFSLIFDIRHSKFWTWDLVWYMIFDFRFECWISFDIRYSTFKIWMWDWVWYSIFDLNVGFSLIFDIRFECWIQFDIRYSTFDLNVGFSLLFDIRYSTFDWNVGFSLIFDIGHSIRMLDLVWYSIFKIWMWDWVWYSIFDIRFECWIQFDIRYSTFDLNVGISLIFDIDIRFEC